MNKAEANEGATKSRAQSDWPKDRSDCDSGPRSEIYALYRTITNQPTNRPGRERGPTQEQPSEGYLPGAFAKQMRLRRSREHKARDRRARATATGVLGAEPLEENRRAACCPTGEKLPSEAYLAGAFAKQTRQRRCREHKARDRRARATATGEPEG